MVYIGRARVDAWGGVIVRPAAKFLVGLLTVVLTASTGGLPAGAATVQATPTLTCSYSPNPATTMMDTQVTGKVTCVHSGGLAVTYKLVPYRVAVYGPFNGKMTKFDSKTGTFTYLPGYYPVDPETGKQEKLPEFSGEDEFTVTATASDGLKKNVRVVVDIQAPAKACSKTFTAKTSTLFNDPSGSASKQYKMLKYLISMIECTPTVNPDGSQATIKFSFYSLSYAPIQAALAAAAKRGVAVQALTNSHADKYPAWKSLVKKIGSNSKAKSFAATCWQGCLLPRTPPAAGAPTAWYSAQASSLTSRKVTFRDRSIAGAAKIVKWQWSFGDGHHATGKGPHVHTYRKYGTYSTSLKVTDEAGKTHTMRGSKTLPDDLEPEYPSLHSKVYLFSTVGTGSHSRQWVAAYSSGNPTYQQSRKGFNNLNVAVGDKKLYTILDSYYKDLVKGSQGRLLTRNYFHTDYTPGNSATGARPTTIHFGPQASGDINRDILKSIQCRYKVNGVWKRTDVRLSMYVLTRKGVASDLWKLAMQKGCNVEIVYTQTSQRLKGANGKWLKNKDGKTMGYGAADCLATPATKVVYVKKNGRKVRKVVKNSLNGPNGLCSGGTLKGHVPVTSNGIWVNRKSPYGGGRLIVRMSCPVAPKYDPVTKVWSVRCIRNDIFTHHKVLMVNGYIRGKAQKYVMTGSANWSTPGLRSSDEIITEIQSANALYDQYRGNYNYMKKVVTKNSKKRKGSSVSKVYALDITGGQQLDVRGMTDEQLGLSG